MQRSPEEFKTKAKEKNIEKWIIHNCSLCGYPCGYHIQGGGEYVGYDSGCNCGGFDGWRDSSWFDLADHYNRQTHADCMKRYDEFWGFDPIAKAA